MTSWQAVVKLGFLLKSFLPFPPSTPLYLGLREILAARFLNVFPAPLSAKSTSSAPWSSYDLRNGRTEQAITQPNRPTVVTQTYDRKTIEGGHGENFIAFLCYPYIPRYRGNLNQPRVTPGLCIRAKTTGSVYYWQFGKKTSKQPQKVFLRAREDSSSQFSELRFWLYQLILQRDKEVYP